MKEATLAGFRLERHRENDAADVWVNSLSQSGQTGIASPSCMNRPYPRSDARHTTHKGGLDWLLWLRQLAMCQIHVPKPLSPGNDLTETA